MTWELRREEFDAVVRLPAPEAYAHFVKRVAQHEEVWALRDEGGWVMVGDDDGHVLLPVWPHARYAAACAAHAREEAEPIDIDDFVEEWLPGLEADGYGVAVFPRPPDGEAVHVDCARLKDDLEAELERYEL